MADQYDQGNENLNTTKPQEEIKDRGGLFSFFGKKEEEKPQDNAIMADHGEEKKPSLMEKLHRTKSSSSSSSSSEDEVVEEGGVMIRRKKKKGLKEKIKEKISSDPKEHQVGKNEAHAIPVVVEPCSEPVQAAPSQEENKGLLEKLKEKLPGHHKGGGEPAVSHQSEEEGKKGLMDKIKEKLPGSGAHKEHS